jgi:hypothetical protein
MLIELDLIDGGELVSVPRDSALGWLRESPLGFGTLFNLGNGSVIVVVMICTCDSRCLSISCYINHSSRRASWTSAGGRLMSIQNIQYLDITTL